MSVKQDYSKDDLSDGDEPWDAEDRYLRSALFSTEVPRGLRERILDRLHREAKVSASNQVAASGEVGECGGGEEDIGQESVDQQAVQATPPTPAFVVDRSLRRRGFLLAVVAASVALLFGLYQWSRPLTTDQLAGYCLQELDRLLAPDSPRWDDSPSEHMRDLDILKGHLQPNVQPLAFQERAGDHFSELCRVWQFHSRNTHQQFYVFDFRDARSVPSLQGQLQSIRQVSGGWSLVAMRRGERIIVVAFSGRARDYLNSLPAA